MRRWHPDKFLQKLGDRIVKKEKEEVADDDDDDYDNNDDDDNCNDDDDDGDYDDDVDVVNIHSKSWSHWSLDSADNLEFSAERLSENAKTINSAIC